MIEGLLSVEIGSWNRAESGSVFILKEVLASEDREVHNDLYCTVSQNIRIEIERKTQLSQAQNT